MYRLLIVEDEPAMLRGLRDNLEAEGYDVDSAMDGKSGLEKVLGNTYDLIILDVMLPQLSGFDVLKKVREKGIGTPTIMLTARGEEIDRVVGLELGADDYITKPFSLRELLARVKAVLRRAEGHTVGSSKMVVENVEVDFSTYTAVRDGQAMTLTPKEYDVLKFLWDHRNSVVSRDQLLTNVWVYNDSLSTRTVDNFIARLRQKIEKDPSVPRHILTVHGTGYKFVV